MPRNYRDAPAITFNAGDFHDLLDAARVRAGHTWVNVARSTGVGLDTFRRLRAQPLGRPDEVTPRLPQYLSMVAYIAEHSPDLDTVRLLGGEGRLYAANDTTETSEPAA